MEIFNTSVFFAWFLLMWFFVAYASGVIVARKTYHKKIDSFIAFLYGFFLFRYGYKLVLKRKDRFNNGN